MRREKHTIVVLANSNKNRHRCVAGIEVTSGEWVRPVSNRGQGELSDSEASVILSNGKTRPTRVGDIVEVELGKSAETRWHPEDRYLIGHMRLKTTMSLPSLTEYLRPHISNTLAILGDFQDRIAVEEVPARSDHRSLQLSKFPELRCYWKSVSPGSRPQLRGVFSVAGKDLDLPVTDSALIASSQALTRSFSINSPLLTVSLGSPFRPMHADRDYCYKLIAAVIAPERPLF